MKDKLIVNYWNDYKKLRKHDNKEINTVIIKDYVYNGSEEYYRNVIINNLIIQNKGRYNTDIYNTKCKNIYLGINNNQEGLNVSSDNLNALYENKISFKWDPNSNLKANIDKLNVLHEGKDYTFYLNKEELESIRLYKDKRGRNFKLTIEIKSINCDMEYTIYNDEIQKYIEYKNITKNDLINGTLDLTKFNDYSILTLSDIKIDTLIINKEYIKKLNDIDINDNVFIKNIKIIDNNEIKLNPINQIPFEDCLEISGKYIEGQNNKILIYLDKKKNIKVYKKEEILKDKDIESIEFIWNYGTYIILYKYKNKYKVFIDDNEYIINKLFIFFAQNALFRYNLDTKAKTLLENNDIKTFLSDCISIKVFHTLYYEYLEFKKNFKKLFNRGFTYDYFMYLHERGLDRVILEMCKNTFDDSKFNNLEISELNTLGKKYVKKLSRCNNESKIK